MGTALPTLPSGPVEEVAPRLLGWVLRAPPVALRITEVEAYGGAGDPGSHAHRGPTARNATMFGPPGRLYCYLSYGIHVCANVVTGPEGCGEGVLLRAAQVLEGLDVVQQRRTGAADRDLARGPARLTRSLGVGLADDGTDLLALASAIRLEPGERTEPVASGPRVGLTKAADRPWRFWLEGAGSVSAYRRSPRAHTPS